MGAGASVRIGRVEGSARLAAAALAGVLAVMAPASAARIVVTTAADTVAADGGCSLREAIQAANGDLAVQECPAGSGADRIEFALPLPATIALAGPLTTISSALLIQGPGSAELEINGQGMHPILTYNGGAAGLEVRDLTLADGNAGAFFGGGAEIGLGGAAAFRRVVFLANRAKQGGGLWAAAEAQVEIDACWFADNAAIGDYPYGGGLYMDRGGSSSSGRLTIDRSTFSANRVEGSGGQGGAVWTAQPTTIARSTFSGNVANGTGGALLIEKTDPPNPVTVRHSTLTGNTADATGAGPYLGGGIAAALGGVGGGVDLTLNNSIVADNADGGGPPSSFAPDLYLGLTAVVTTLGHNLIGDHTGAEASLPFGQPNANLDYVGDTVSPLDPSLESLQFNGGPTPTRRPRLSPLSLALDNGKCPSSTSDQRGYGDRAAFTRAVDLGSVPNGPDSPAGCDIGAFERGGEEGSDPDLFADGFESGTAFPWSHEGP